MNPLPALLVLEDGRSFVGRSFGAEGETFGELVFSTGMSGYQETLTDPSYRGQVVLATAPHIGNTGWNDEDDESGQIQVAGYVVRDPAPRPSNWRSRRSLDAELAAQGVVGICDIDTRALTRHIRSLGAMRAGISTRELDPQKLRARVLQQPVMVGAALFGDVSTPQVQVIPARGQRQFRVAAVDLGIKTMTPAQMASRGMEVHVLPAATSFEEITALEPDGVFFSNGPGDPSAADDPVALLRRVLHAGIPYFGICFGNQLFGRALGFGTYKLKFGHRGINSPCWTAPPEGSRSPPTTMASPWMPPWIGASTPSSARPAFRISVSMTMSWRVLNCDEMGTWWHSPFNTIRRPPPARTMPAISSTASPSS